MGGDIWNLWEATDMTQIIKKNFSFHDSIFFAFLKITIYYAVPPPPQKKKKKSMAAKKDIRCAAW